jgi:hypothetical protein
MFIPLAPQINHPDTQANFTQLASFIALLTKSDTIQRVLFSIPAVPFKEPLPAYSPSVLSTHKLGSALKFHQLVVFCSLKS